jgi:hypothetical protein
MEEIDSINSTPTFHAPVLCAACFKNITEADAFCNNCGYPLNGTDQEQRFFISERNSKEIDLDHAHKEIKKAGNILFYIAGFTLVLGSILAATSHDGQSSSLFITNVVLAIIFAGLGFWSRKKPLPAIISGFALYALIIILNAVVSPLTILSGIIFKIIFIGLFIRGVKSAIAAEKLKKELGVE